MRSSLLRLATTIVVGLLVVARASAVHPALLGHTDDDGAPTDQLASDSR